MRSVLEQARILALMQLNHDAIALLEEALDAATGAAFPVAYLRAGYLPEDVGGDVLYRPAHLRLQRARVRQTLALDLDDAPAARDGNISVAEWLADTSRLPDEDDWGAFTPPSVATPEPEGPVRGAEAAAAILRVDRSTVDRRIRALPPEQRPTPVGAGKRRRWWWASRSAVIEWWVATGSRPTTTPPRRARPTAAAPAADKAVDVRAALTAARRRA